MSTLTTILLAISAAIPTILLLLKIARIIARRTKTPTDDAIIQDAIEIVSEVQSHPIQPGGKK
jgi:hypothetical protein